MLAPDIFATPPFHINELGVKFWDDKESTQYARRKGLKDIHVLLVETPDGVRTRLVTENGIALKDDSSIEGIACYLDMLAIVRKQNE